MASFSSAAFSTASFSENAFDFGSVTPVEDNGWLGGGLLDHERKKKYLEELDLIDENIRRKRYAPAVEALAEIRVPIETPVIKKYDASYVKELKDTELDITALIAEIALIREYLLAEQILADLKQRELDDEMAFMLMLN